MNVTINLNSIDSLDFVALSRIFMCNMKEARASQKAKQKLYFIAIVPPSPIYDEALEQKEYFKAKYNSKASLNSPPHITLHMPFRWSEKEEKGT